MIRLGNVRGRLSHTLALLDLVLWTLWYCAGSSSESPRTFKEAAASVPVPKPMMSVARDFSMSTCNLALETPKLSPWLLNTCLLPEHCRPNCTWCYLVVACCLLSAHNQAWPKRLCNAVPSLSLQKTRHESYESYNIHNLVTMYI